MLSRSAEPEAGPPGLWDPVVRVTHWGTACVVLLNGVVVEGGGLAHVWIGWIGLALVLLRMIWGVVGPSEARFTAFPPDPRAALRHLRALAKRETPRYRSHNPAGALMVYAFWATLVVIIGTGIAMTGTGPFGAYERARDIETADWSQLDLGGGAGDEEADGVLKDVHEVAANLILILAVLHVAGVAVESRLTRHDLLRPMLAGSRRGPGARP